MSATASTTTLPLGFERSARVLESIRDEEIAPLIHIADTNPDGEARRQALVTLGNAGILPPLRWVPSVGYGSTAPVEIVTTTPDSKATCAPGRKRHRYTPGGACQFCPARDPRKARAPRGSLADSIKEVPLASAPPASGVDAGYSILPEASADSPGAASLPAGVVSALPEAAPATLSQNDKEQNDAALENDGGSGLPRSVRLAGARRDLHDRAGGAGRPEASGLEQVGPEAGDPVRGEGQAVRGERDQRDNDLADVRPAHGAVDREADHVVPDHREVEGAGRGGDPRPSDAAPKRSARRAPRRNAADRDRSEPDGAVLVRPDAGGDRGDPGAGAGRGGSGTPLPRGLTEPVRFSHLKLLGTRSPAHFKAGVEVAETAAMERGTAVHAMALGTRRVVPYDGVRRGAAWDAFEAANSDAEILPAKAYETARAMADALLAHPVFASGLADARRRGGVEHTIHWTHLGVPCRSTPDLWTPDWVADIKTARTSDPREWEFPRAAVRAHYHAQLAWYAEALRSKKLATPRYHYIFAVEAAPPYVVTVFRLTSADDPDRNARPGALEDGDKTWRRWFEALRVCLDSDAWPPYSAVTCEIDVEQEMPALTFGTDDDDQDDAAQEAA